MDNNNIKNLNIKELLNIAIQLEESGIEFYKIAAEQSKNEKVRNLMLNLMDMEKGHKQKFAQILERHGEEVVDSDYLGDDISLYLSTILNTPFFTKEDEIKGFIKNNSLEKILNYALQTEKDSITFYNELLDLLKFNDSKEFTKQIISEEKNHVILLEKIKQEIL